MNPTPTGPPAFCTLSYADQRQDERPGVVIYAAAPDHREVVMRFPARMAQFFQEVATSARKTQPEGRGRVRGGPGAAVTAPVSARRHSAPQCVRRIRDHVNEVTCGTATGP
jgi:hypothetical protein